MFALTSFAVATALLVPTLLAEASSQECPATLSQRVSDDRAVARFVDAVRDYAAFGKTRSIFNPEAAEVLRFQLRLTRWLHRYDAVETLSEPALTTRVRGGADAFLLSALPPLPARLEYRLHGRHLLLVDRHTRQVIDILDDALGH